jgi:hypothetical protein
MKGEEISDLLLETFTPWRLSYCVTLATGVNYPIGASNNGTAAYVLGTSSANTTIQKLTFSGDTVSAVTATLASSHLAGAAFANSGTL